jgi:hypothetical protein
MSNDKLTIPVERANGEKDEIELPTAVEERRRIIASAPFRYLVFYAFNSAFDEEGDLQPMELLRAEVGMPERIQGLREIENIEAMLSEGRKPGAVLTGYKLLHAPPDTPIFSGDADAIITKDGELPAWLMYKAPAIILLLDEREAQDAKHGGATHDDTHAAYDWIEFIREELGDYDAARSVITKKRSEEVARRLVRIGALALAGLESIARKTDDKEEAKS